MAEIWKDIRGYEGMYQVSSHGRVRSLSRKSTSKRHGKRVEISLKGRILKSVLGKKGYTQVTLHKDGSSKTFGIHCLVAAAFIGERPPGFDVCHKNGVRSSNKSSNLRYGTRAENKSDELTHGTRLRGEKHLQSKLSEKDVVSIRKRLEGGEKQCVLAREFSVTKSTINKIHLRVTWSHV